VCDQRTKRFVDEVKEYDKASYLLHALERNPLLAEICEKELLVLVLNSSTSQGLQDKLTGLLKSSQLTQNEAALLYTSENKVKAMEDCIEFSPELFRVSKSIVVSEPLVPFNQLIQMRFAIETPHQTQQNAKKTPVITSEYLKDKIRDLKTMGTLQSANTSGSLRVPTMRAQLTGMKTQIIGGQTQLRDLLHSQTVNPFRK